MTKPVLAAPDLDKEFRVEANASKYATGGVLLMKCSDKKWRPVAFISKSLSDTERNYKIHDKCKSTLGGAPEHTAVLLYDRKYPFNNIISFLFYIITNFSILNSCCLLL